MTPPVWWLNLHPDRCNPRHHWDVAILGDLLPALSLPGYEAAGPDPTDDGSIVIIPGRFHHEDAEAIEAMLADLDWCLVLVVSDEEALFPTIRHPNMRLWRQTPGLTSVYDRILPLGAPPFTLGMLHGRSTAGRELDWFFAGQVTHERRRECYEVLSAQPWQPVYLPWARLIPTQAFTAGVPRREYLGLLARAKIAPCPSGPVCPETFRVWEALEAGCVPVVDEGPVGHERPGYWEALWGGRPPFPVVTSWREFPAVAERILASWPEHQAEAFSARAALMADLRQALEADLKALCDG